MVLYLKVGSAVILHYRMKCAILTVSFGKIEVVTKDNVLCPKVLKSLNVTVMIRFFFNVTAGTRCSILHEFINVHPGNCYF